MLLFEAKEKIDNVKKENEALEIASKCIEAQMRLADLLNDLQIDLYNEIHEKDMYSIRLVYEMLSSIRFDAKFDEDGMYVDEDCE